MNYIQNKPEGNTSVNIFSLLKGMIGLIATRIRFILSVTILFALMGALIAFMIKPSYKAEVVLMLQTPASGGGLASYLQLANQLGMISGGGLNVDEDKIVDLIKARTIVTKALLKTANINGGNDLLVNHYAEFYNFKKNNDSKWFKISDTNEEKFSYSQDSVMNKLVRKIIEENINIQKKPFSYFIQMNVSSVNEELSYTLCKNLTDEAISFYMNNKLATDLKNISIIEQKSDSIKTELAEAEARYAGWKDASNMIIKAQGYIQEVRLRREVEILNAMFIEVAKTLETSKLTMMFNTPVLKIIDLSKPPLQRSMMTNKTIAYPLFTIAGAIIGLVLSVLIILLAGKIKELSV